MLIRGYKTSLVDHSRLQKELSSEVVYVTIENPAVLPRLIFNWRTFLR